MMENTIMLGEFPLQNKNTIWQITLECIAETQLCV